LNTLEFEEFNDDCNTEENTILGWKNDEAVIEDDVVSFWGNDISGTDDCGGSDDNAGRSDAGAAVTVNDLDDDLGHTVTNDTGTDTDDADADDNNSDFDAIASDSDDVGDATTEDADLSTGDGANDADFDAGDVANDPSVGIGNVANDADVFDDSGSDAEADAANDAKGDTGDAANEGDDDDDDNDRGASSSDDADADTTKLDNIATWLSLGEEVTVVGNKVPGLVTSDSATKCIDSAWIPDVWSWLGVVTPASTAVLLLSLTCVAEILTFVWYARLFVDAVKNALVLWDDIVRFFKIYSIPLHSRLWITNTSPTGQTKLAYVFSGNSVSLTAIKE